MELAVRQWFETYLDRKDYESLLKQLKVETLTKSARTLTGAFNQFVWNETTEGYDYWDKIYQNALKFENIFEAANDKYVSNFDPFYKAKGYVPTITEKTEKRPFPREKEIIGYKAPHDLFQGRIKKDSIFSLYSPKKLVMYTTSHQSSGVPTEIVHTWEPVYAPYYVQISVGRPAHVVTLKENEEIEVHGKLIAWGQIQKIYEIMRDKKVGEWKATFTEITIGCSKFSKEDITRIWEAFTKLNNKSL